MKPFNYEELLAESQRQKKEHSNVLGTCCNCMKTVYKNEIHTTTFNNGYEYLEEYCCENCQNYEIELMAFCFLLSCCLGTRSWDKLNKNMKGLNDD